MYFRDVKIIIRLYPQKKNFEQLKKCSHFRALFYESWEGDISRFL